MKREQKIIIICLLVSGLQILFFGRSSQPIGSPYKIKTTTLLRKLKKCSDQTYQTIRFEFCLILQCIKFTIFIYLLNIYKDKLVYFNITKILSLIDHLLILASLKSMPIYHEQWKQADYIPRNNQYLRDLPRNHLQKIATVKFEFSDYKIYNKLACVPYERMIIQCVNNYGVMGALKNQQCAEIYQHFNTCIRTNQVLGKLKATQPEYFADSDYSRDKPHFSELKI